MSKVVARMSMSLDGYVADPDDGVAEVFAWCFNSGDVEFHTGGADPMTFTVPAPSAEQLRSLVSGLGAMPTGRCTIDMAHGWDGALRLGSGVRLFDHLIGTPAVLGNPTVTAGVGVTHLRYPVRKA